MRAEDMTLWERLTDERFLHAVGVLGAAGLVLLVAALLADRYL